MAPDGAGVGAAAWVAKRIPFAGRAVMSGRNKMDFPHFLRIERDGADSSQHYVVHTADPKFAMELMPDGAAPDQIGRGVIKRVCVPNSWAGDYLQYARLMGAAQEFFAESFAQPAPKAEVRRIAR